MFLVSEGVNGVARAAVVTQLELTDGTVNSAGRQGRILDRLFGRQGHLLSLQLDRVRVRRPLP